MFIAIIFAILNTFSRYKCDSFLDCGSVALLFNGNISLETNNEKKKRNIKLYIFT